MSSPAIIDFKRPESSAATKRASDGSGKLNRVSPGVQDAISRSHGLEEGGNFSPTGSGLDALSMPRTPRKSNAA